MRLPTFLTILSSIFTYAAARIEGIAAPRTIAPGSSIPITIITAGYIQSVQDVAMSFSISSMNIPGALPGFIDSKFLGRDDSNIITNRTHWVTVPRDLQKGRATLATALMSLYGAAFSPTITYFNVTVTITDSTSSDLVSSLH